MAVDRIEIDARRHGNAGIGEQLLAKGHAVIGEVPDIDPGVKGAIGRGDARQPQPRQRTDEMGAVATIGVLIAFEHLRFVHRGERGVLGQRRRGEEQAADIGAQQLGGPLRRDDPAEPPAGHRIIFRKAVDDDGAIIEFEQRMRRRVIGEAVVDLVRNDADAAALGNRGDGGKARRIDHRAGRVGRAGEDQALRRVHQCFEMTRGNLETRGGIGADLHRHPRQREHGVAIGDIARPGEGDAVPRCEQRRDGERQRRAGTVGEDDAAGIDGKAMAFGIKLRDALDERRAFPIAAGFAIEPMMRGGDGARRRAG